ncbi:Uma2 family endonuclease [Gemmata sp.]|uniref:Uma2 family endonuclease n=1 Tax=Gemmata sp. TaxID=1914242 RepID=UPI003F711DCF
MTAATITPPPAPQPPVAPRAVPQPAAAGWSPRRWTIAEYRKLGETVVFDGVKTMLIHGEVFTMALPKPPHDTALSLLHEFLRTAFAAGHYVRNQQGFDIGTDNDPGPDLAVVTGTIRDYANRTPTAAVLIAEVSETTLFMDLTTKAELYATAAVPEYWVVDLPGRQLHVFRDPVPLPAGLGATAYRSHTTHAETETVAPRAAPAAAVRVADLLP